MTEKTAQPGAQPEQPLPGYALQLAEDILQPNITEKLLNAQLAEAVFLLRDAGFMYRNSELPGEDRRCFIDHSVSVMRASSEIADRIARLQGGAPNETRYRYIVEHVQGEQSVPQAPGGGGGPIPENE